MLVIEQMAKIGRVRVGSFMAEGVRPLGWVTQQKDGQSFLTVVQEPSSPGVCGHDLNCSSRLKSQIAAHRLTSSTFAHQLKTRAASAGARLPSRSEIGRGDGAAELGGLLSSAKLRELASSYLSEATVAEGVSFETFSTKLGRILASKGGKVDYLVNEWDRSGDGSISKFEFAVGVRKMLEAELDVAKLREMQGGGAARQASRERAHARTHTYTHVYASTSGKPREQGRPGTHTHAYAHGHIYARTHTHTHTSGEQRE